MISGAVASLYQGDEFQVIRLLAERCGPRRMPESQALGQRPFRRHQPRPRLRILKQRSQGFRLPLLALDLGIHCLFVVVIVAERRVHLTEG